MVPQAVDASKFHMKDTLPLPSQSCKVWILFDLGMDWVWQVS